MGSTRELAAVGATMAARFLRFEAERGREREWRQPRCVVAVFRDENGRKRSIGGQITFIFIFFLENEIDTILSETNTTPIFR
jgi:hypothetical protein